MKRLIIISIISIFVMAVAAVPALAHVHGITPLFQLACSNVGNTPAGAISTNGTPAAAANGGPIMGLIPRDVGNAPLTGGDGGFGATGDNCNL